MKKQSVDLYSEKYKLCYTETLVFVAAYSWVLYAVYRANFIGVTVTMYAAWVGSYLLLSIPPPEITGDLTRNMRKQNIGTAHCLMLPLIYLYQTNFLPSSDLQNCMHRLQLNCAACVISIVMASCLKLNIGAAAANLLSGMVGLISFGISSFLHHFSTKQDYGWSRILTQMLLLVIFWLWMIRAHPTFPQTFSHAESSLVGLGLINLLLSLTRQMVDGFGSDHIDFVIDHTSNVVVAAVIFLGIVSIVISRILQTWRSSLFYMLESVLIALLIYHFLNFGILPVLLSFLLQPDMVLLILYWSALVILSLVVVWYYQTRSVTSAIRKYFHLFAILIYLPGLAVSPPSIRLASAVALAAFIFIEVIRWQNISPYGSMINESLGSFLDQQDSGSLILTHIYLLCGMACPLWLCPEYDSRSLALYSGVISLGVGDSFAVLIGKTFGRHRYPGSTKTLEGTLGAWVSMIVCCWILQVTGVVDTNEDAVVTSSRLLLIAVMESSTLQIDNLTLPLFAYTLLQPA